MTLAHFLRVPLQLINCSSCNTKYYLRELIAARLTVTALRLFNEYGRFLRILSRFSESFFGDAYRYSSMLTHERGGHTK